jgi:hypothetical protein
MNRCSLAVDWSAIAGTNAGSSKWQPRRIRPTDLYEPDQWRQPLASLDLQLREEKRRETVITEFAGLLFMSTLPIIHPLTYQKLERCRSAGTADDDD